MKHFKFLLLAGIVLLAIQSMVLAADTDEDYPKTGIIRRDGVNIKAGDNANYENICALDKSDPIKIIGKRYSWYKVLLPKKAYLYISEDFIELTPDEKGIGIVTGFNVNLRAGPGTKYSILGQVSKSEKVNIISKEDGWYKIEAPYGTAGWIQDSHLDLVSENLANIPMETKETPAKTVSPVSSVRKVFSNKPEKSKEEPVTTAAPSTKKEPNKVRLNLMPPAPQGNLSISSRR